MNADRNLNHIQDFATDNINAPSQLHSMRDVYNELRGQYKGFHYKQQNQSDNKNTIISRYKQQELSNIVDNVMNRT